MIARSILLVLIVYRVESRMWSYGVYARDASHSKRTCDTRSSTTWIRPRDVDEDEDEDENETTKILPQPNADQIQVLVM